MLTGFGAEVGVFLSPNLAIGAEFRRPFQRADISTSNSYMLVFEQIQSRYRETSAFGTVRGVWRVGSRGRVGVVGGAGLLIGYSLERIIRTGVTSSSETEQHVSNTFFGTMFGGEFVIAASASCRMPDSTS